jgi:hypothetical protein
MVDRANQQWSFLLNAFAVPLPPEAEPMWDGS